MVLILLFTVIVILCLIFLQQLELTSEAESDIRDCSGSVFFISVIARDKPINCSALEKKP